MHAAHLGRNAVQGPWLGSRAAQVLLLLHVFSGARQQPSCVPPSDDEKKPRRAVKRKVGGPSTSPQDIERTNLTGPTKGGCITLLGDVAHLIYIRTYGPHFPSVPAGSKIAGVRNAGFSCYLNCLLQAILATPGLLGSLFRSSDHVPGCSVLGMLRSTLLEMLGARDRVIDPRQLIEWLCHPCGGNVFKWGVQLDPGEALLRIHDSMEDDLIKFQNTDMHSLFRACSGYCTDQVKCRNCFKTWTSKPDPFQVLYLPIASAASLQEAFFNFKTQMSAISDPRICTYCGSSGGSACTSVAKSPEVFVLVLHRFTEVDGRPGVFRKEGHYVSFPTTFSLADFQPTTAINATYFICAVVVHIGSAGDTQRGHYIVYVKRDGTWYCCNDSVTTEVSEEHVLASHAYMLFFQRVESRNEQASLAQIAPGPAPSIIANSTVPGITSESNGKDSRSILSLLAPTPSPRSFDTLDRVSPSLPVENAHEANLSNVSKGTKPACTSMDTVDTHSDSQLVHADDFCAIYDARWSGGDVVCPALAGGATAPASPGNATSPGDSAIPPASGGSANVTSLGAIPPASGAKTSGSGRAPRCRGVLRRIKGVLGKFIFGCMPGGS